MGGCGNGRPMSVEVAPAELEGTSKVTWPTVPQ